MIQMKPNRDYVWNVCFRIPGSTSKTVHAPSFMMPLYEVIWDAALEGTDMEVELLEPRKELDEDGNEKGDYIYGVSEVFNCAKTKAMIKSRWASKKVDGRPVFSIAYPGRSFEREFEECLTAYSTKLTRPRALTRAQFEDQANASAQEADDRAAKAIEMANKEAQAIAAEAGIDLEQEDAEDLLGREINAGEVEQFNDGDIKQLPILSRKSEVVEALIEFGFDTVSSLSTATVKQLSAIKGIGEGTASKIITQSQSALPDSQYT